MNKWENLYMEFCNSVSKLSTSKRLKVGSVIVKENNIISYGYNGTPAGTDNSCEIRDANGLLVTKQEVIHSEINAIAKAVKQGISVNDSILFCNISPCVECSKLIIQSGIKKVIYQKKYRCQKGIDLLLQCGIEVIKFKNKINGIENRKK